jgi:nucleotide-binding universal stress UspA family protein
MSLRRVLVPVDFAKHSQRALAYAFELAELSGAAIDVLHVIPPPSLLRVAVDAYLGWPLPRPSPWTVTEARFRVRDALDACDRRGIVPFVHVEAGEPAATIVRVAAELGADAIVLATRGHRGVGELVFGSVAHRVITTAGCPVIALGGQAKASIRPALAGEPRAAARNQGKA